ncbi:MAG: hypothetical protein ABW033_06005, partial [Acidimicrobiia bacterium]
MAESTRADRRRRSKRGRIVAVVAVVVLLAAGVGIFAASQGDDDTANTAQPSSSSADRVTAPNVFADLGNQTFRTASVNGKDIPVYAAPDPNAQPIETLSRRTEYQIP